MGNDKILERNVLPPVPEPWLPGQDPGRLLRPFQRLENSAQPRVQAARQDQLSGEKVMGVDLHHLTHPIYPPCLKNGQGQFGFGTTFFTMKMMTIF